MTNMAETGTTPDWSQGPVACTTCGRPMRPRGWEKSDEWAETIQYGAAGQCMPCRAKEDTSRRTAGAPSRHAGNTGPAFGGSRPSGSRGMMFLFRWPMLDSTMPLAHQIGEATADLMDALRREGLVLAGSPLQTIRHGSPAFVDLECPVRRATRDEAALLEHEVAE